MAVQVVVARFIHNGRLVDALTCQAFASLNASPGARALYDDLRARGIEHNDALRRVANTLVGILHGCLKTRTLYDEATACSHRGKTPQSDVAAWHLSSWDVSVVLKIRPRYGAGSSALTEIGCQRRE